MRRIAAAANPSFGRRTFEYVGKRISPAVCFARKYDAWGRRKKPPFVTTCRQPSATPPPPPLPALGCRARNGSLLASPQRPAKHSEVMSKRGFSGCYFARKYNCMGTPKKKPPLSKGGWREFRNEDISGCYFARKQLHGTPRNPTARGSLFTRNGGKAPDIRGRLTRRRTSRWPYGSCMA